MAQDLDYYIDYFLDALPRLGEPIRKNLKEAATRKFGISLEQFHALRHLSKDCRSVSELAEKKGISRPAASQSVEALAARGLVTRRQESGDRRCVALELTEEARRVLNENRAENREWMRGILAGEEPSRLAELRAAVEAISGILARGAKGAGR